MVLTFATLASYAQESETPKSRYPSKGYRFFVNVGALVCADADALTISTIHGAQILPKLFVGGGFEIQSVEFTSMSMSDEGYSVGQFFSNVRFDIVQKRISPFLDLRAGVQVGDLGSSAYLSPAAGLRFGHFNLSLAYESKPDVVDSEFDVKDYKMLAIRLGIDFGARK